MAQKYANDSLVMYTAAVAAAADNTAGDIIKFATVAGNPGAPFFAIGSRIVGKVIIMNANGYTVQFGPTDAAAAAALQILNIPEAQLKKITILNDVVVAGVGGSRKKRQSKKKNNKHNNKNNQ
jgi:hypothetical protein